MCAKKKGKNKKTFRNDRRVIKNEAFVYPVKVQNTQSVYKSCFVGFTIIDVPLTRDTD